METTNILVTGGAGYIGSHIVQLLCEKNYNVFVLDNFSLGHKSNIDKRVKKVIIGDVRNSEDLEAAFDNEIHAVFHFAAWKAAGESMTNPGKYAENNICGTLTLLNSMVNHNVNKFVFSSSAAVYGSPEYLPIDENHPKNPENYYGYTKLAIEENLKWYSELKGLKFAALRYFNATGYDINGVIKGREKNPANLSPIVMEVVSGERTGMQVYGNDYDTRDGSCIRDYIHVSDLAEAHLLALQYLEEKGENLIVNLGTGNGSSVLEVIESANRITGKNVRYEIIARRPGDPANLVASSDLAYKLLGWKAKYSDMDTIIKSMMPVYF
ncbi:MAG: UDP-glucose 4-epimerase GalE [Ignavibacteriae bacterium HGW-Ignavibacteriae-2]|jgi:UDP-glucose 4-epimerase|nr:MAG: UDP-glucose 4-epimerase GalE [Ignavibacteriae bacterium HGW-Ignavibacteriae-2]